jgi:choline dehydrogenase-like flavoprotein
MLPGRRKPAGNRKEPALATEPADVLIIGAGASGGVVARRLSEAGFKVVCLEQGDWHDKSEFRGIHLDWELTARKQWATSPNIRGLAEDYPIVEEDTPVSPLMFSGVGGSMLIFAGAWPRMLPSDFRVRSLDGIADDWPLTYDDLLPFFRQTDRDFGVSGLAGDPAYPPDPEDPPLPPLPIGAAGMKVARAHTRLGWHWWPEFNSILSAPYDGRRPCVQRSTCQSGCNEGAKASTDLTHWPKAINQGARLVTGARVRRIETDAKGLATGATWIDRDGREHFEPAKVVVLASNAIGTPRLLLLSADARHPDGLANSSGLVGKRLMMHPFANVAGLFEEPLMSWQGQFGDLIESLEFYETDERRGFVRGARWGLAPTGGPINTALPSRAGTQVWGPDHHLHVRSHLGHGANWGLFAEDLPDEANHVTLSDTVTDSSGIAAPAIHYAMGENARKMLDFHIERATESLLEAGAHAIEVDRLMRYSGWHLLGTARMGDDPATSVLDRWNRTHDVPNLYVVDGSCFVTSSGVNPTSTIVALALRAAEHMVETRFEQQVPA